jgi:hypothetical protein
MRPGGLLSETACFSTDADRKQIALATGSAVLLPGRSASLADLKLD